jgi:DNA-directed RNA polymerase specialized sigma24 family protein
MSNDRKPSQPKKGKPRRSGNPPSGKGGQQRGKGGANQGRGAQNNRGQQGRKPPAGDDRVAELAGPLSRVLQRLPETQRRVLELRMGLVDGYSRNLSDTASELGLSMHEAKEIEARAFEHIREVVPLSQLKKLLKP